MNRGLAVPRSTIFRLQSGEVVIDWGDGRIQDILTGEFRTYNEHDFAGPVQDSDLESLRNNARVDAWDVRTVYLRPLPEPPRRTID